jgi:hypothetical protein
MATASRVFWESVIFLAFLAILAGVVFWSGGRAERHKESLAVEHEAALSEAAQRHRDEIDTLRQSWDELSAIRAQEQAKAIFSAFEAGIHTAAAARWGRYLDNARDGLMEQPAVTFVHLVTLQGRVITSSDSELAATGRLDERGDWALAAQQLSSRTEGGVASFELAAPVLERGQPVAILWIGFDLGVITANSADPS